MTSLQASKGGRGLRGPRIRIPFSAALLFTALVTAGAPARADFDLTNRWVVSGESEYGGLLCVMDFTQNGSDLHITGCLSSLDGTVDPVTGEFSADGSAAFFVGTSVVVYPFTMVGSASPDGRTLSGFYHLIRPGTFQASLCGNDRLDPGEQCDDGSDTGDCCSDQCTLEPDGSVCTSTGGSTPGLCNDPSTCSAGICTDAPKAAGTPCESDDNECRDRACDGAGTCVTTRCSPCCGGTDCTTPLPRLGACKGPASPSSSVLIRSRGIDKLKLVIPSARSTSVEDLGDPTSDTDYHLCVYSLDEISGPTLLLDATAPAASSCGGRPCWTRTASGGVRYRSRSSDPDRIALLSIKPGDGDDAAVRVLGRGDRLQLPSPLGPLGGGRLRPEIHTSDSCWGATFLLNDNNPPNVNEADQLRGKAGLD